jgi:hypothetical protein
MTDDFDKGVAERSTSSEPAASPMQRMLRQIDGMYRQIDAATWLAVAVFMAQLVALIVIAVYTRRMYIALLHSVVWVR